MNKIDHVTLTPAKNGWIIQYRFEEDGTNYKVEVFEKVEDMLHRLGQLVGVRGVRTQ